MSESFLKRMMYLYVASHYKNSPNDLQLMSDAPAHRLFVLLAPMEDDDDDDDDDDGKGGGGRRGDGSSPKLPDILCVVQVALEGSINRESVEVRSVVNFVRCLSPLSLARSLARSGSSRVAPAALFSPSSCSCQFFFLFLFIILFIAFLISILVLFFALLFLILCS